jgi:4-amino-4-deoxy-L-arabinose transferase-like glycosyltransferase
MRDRVALILCALTAVVRLIFANRYDVFRDELYFIVCGRHPQFGYADQPPVIPLLNAATWGIAHQVWLLRLPGIVAAVALVWLVVRFTRLLGGGDGAAWMAGIVAACAPMFLGITATMNTTVFELLAWTFVAYALTRALLLDDRRILIWAGIVTGVEFEAKYAIPIWLIGFAVGLACTPERTLLRRRELWIGVALAVVIGAPSVIWQAANGMPFIGLLHATGHKNAVTPPLAFALGQILAYGPLYAPIWIAGIVAPFVARSLRPMRFVAIAYVMCAVTIQAGHGKDYYLAPAVPTLVAIGAVALVRAVRNAYAQGAYVALATVSTLLIAPIALPVLPPAAIPGYAAALHIPIIKRERSEGGTALPQEFADQLGWHDFVAQVTTAWNQIPPERRAHTAIWVDNYGEAAALDVYGVGLPPAISGHNQYGLWGLRGQTPTEILRVSYDMDGAPAHCVGARKLATTFSPFAMSYENGKVIFDCPQVHPAMPELFPTEFHLD